MDCISWDVARRNILENSSLYSRRGEDLISHMESIRLIRQRIECRVLVTMILDLPVPQKG
jgi:hypothetical protein